MTEPHPPSSPRRSNADYRWTKAKAVAFLRALVPTLSVAEAARSVGMSRQSAYRLRARLGPEFAQLWDEGLAIGLNLRKVENAAAVRAAAARRSPLPAQGDGPRQGSRPRQGDGPLQSDGQPVTLAPRGVTLPAQGDTRLAQGDAFRVRNGGFGRRGDV